MRPSGKPADSASPGRRTPVWLLRVVLAVGAPLIVCGGFELALRLAGFGRDPRFFIKDERPDQVRTNPRFTETFLPASFGLKPVNFRMAANKPPGARRIFVIGESAAMGVPEPAFGIAPQLKAHLESVHPRDRFEVYNLGVTAINSHAIRLIVTEALRHAPDLLVIYTGNNEVVGPFGPGSTPGGRMLPLSLIRATIWLRQTRTGQLIERLVGSGTSFAEWRGMQTFAGHRVGPDDGRLAQVYDNFERNLADMLRAAEAAGVPVVLSTVAVNLRDSAPFASVVEPDSAAVAIAESAARRLRVGSANHAMDALETLVQQNPGWAPATFLLGRAKEQVGDMAAARGFFLQALQDDALRFRADARINEIIRSLARSSSGNVHLVEADTVLGSSGDATGAIAGTEFFFEHVHLTWEGNFVLGRELAGAADRALFPDRERPLRWLDSAACAQQVGYTDLGRLAMLRHMDELTRRPPFTGRLTFAEDRLRIEEQIARVEMRLSEPRELAGAIALVCKAADDSPSGDRCFQAAAACAQSGEFARALSYHTRANALMPPGPELAAQRAFLLMNLGRAAEAEQELRNSAERYPYYVQTYMLLGALWSVPGRQAEAVRFFAGLEERYPGSLSARHLHARSLLASGNTEGAERKWRDILLTNPDDEGALAPVVDQLLRRGEKDEALALMLAAHAANPRGFENNARLQAWYAERGDERNSIRFMEAMAASGPVTSELHEDLASLLRKRGDNDTAAEHLALAEWLNRHLQAAQGGER